MARKRPLKTIIFSAILLLMLCNGCQTYNDESDFTVVVHDEKTVEITGYTGSSKDVRIPPRVNGLPVTVIGKEAFWGKELTSVIIPDSVIHIGRGAFNVNKLASVSIPDSVTYIGDFAFANNELTKVIIPNSITSIEYCTFRNNKLTSVTIPEGVVSIGDYAFKDNELTEITIAKSVASIGRGAFENNRLSSRDSIKVTIGDNVDLGYNSFYGFSDFYNNSVRKKGGAYILSNYRWIPEDKTTPVFSFSNIPENRYFPDIAFLPDMPDLEEVDLSGNTILTDITPLSGLTKLKSLRIDSCPNIKSFAPISSLANLESIRIDRIPDMENLDFLSSLTKLKNIYLWNINKHDYSALVPLRQLEVLYIYYIDEEGAKTEIDLSHIGQLRSLKYLSIDMYYEKFININALQNLVNLEKLSIFYIHNSDLSWMLGLRNLAELDLACTINDISPLASLPNLVSVDLTGSNIKDIAPLLNSNSIKYIRVFDDRVEAGISGNLRSRFEQKGIELYTFHDTR